MRLPQLLHSVFNMYRSTGISMITLYIYGPDMTAWYACMPDLEEAVAAVARFQAL